MDKKLILGSAFAVILIGAGIYFALNRQVPSPPREVTPPQVIGPITISGAITCLPKLGTGPQTLECAIGLLATDGNHYGLKNLFDVDPEYKFSRGGLRVEVSGTHLWEEMKGPDGNKYDIAGMIDVISIKEIED